MPTQIFQRKYQRDAVDEAGATLLNHDFQATRLQVLIKFWQSQPDVFRADFANQRDTLKLSIHHRLFNLGSIFYIFYHFHNGIFRVDALT